MESRFKEYNDRNIIPLSIPYTVHGWDGLELSVRIKPGQLRVNSGILTRDHSQFMLPMTNMSSIRGWVNSDPKLAAKAERLQRYMDHHVTW